MRFSTKLCFPLRYLFPLSSHCSQVHPHSQSPLSFPSLLHVRPSALCFVSTVLFVLGHRSVASPSSGLLFSFCFSTIFFLVLSRHDPNLSLVNTCSFFRRCLYPHCTTRSPSRPRRASHVKPPNIYFTLSLAHFIVVKFTQLPVVRTLMLLDTIFGHSFRRIQCSN
jgi:hypothetical protein